MKVRLGSLAKTLYLRRDKIWYVYTGAEIQNKKRRKKRISPSWDQKILLMTTCIGTLLIGLKKI